MADLRDLVAAALAAADAELAGEARAGYLFGDIPVALRLAPAGRIPELAAMIGARRHTIAGPSWSIDVVGGNPDRYGALLPEVARRSTFVLRSTRDIYYLWLNEAGGYLSTIDRRNRRGLVWFTQPDKIASWHVARPLLHSLKGLSLDTAWVPIHAAAVARDGRAALVVGMSGAGKTSIALAAAMTGWDYLGDDVVLVRADPPTAAALYTSCRVRTDMFGMFGGAMTASLGLSDDAGEIKAELDVAQLGDCRTGVARIGAILIPERAGAERPTFAPVRRSDTVRKIVFAARQSIQGDDDVAFAKFAAMVRDVPCYAFDPGPDPFAAAGALGELLAAERAA